MNTRDLRTVETAEAFVHLLLRTRELHKMVDRGSGFDFSLEAPSPMGFQLERAQLLRGKRKDGSAPGRQYSMSGEIPIRDDARAWHKALFSRELHDPLLDLLNAIWASLDGRHRTLLLWSAGYSEDGECDMAPESYDAMASSLARRGWRNGRGALVGVTWVANTLRAARQSVLAHGRFREIGELLR